MSQFKAKSYVTPFCRRLCSGTEVTSVRDFNAPDPAAAALICPFLPDFVCPVLRRRLVGRRLLAGSRQSHNLFGSWHMDQSGGMHSGVNRAAVGAAYFSTWSVWRLGPGETRWSRSSMKAFVHVHAPQAARSSGASTPQCIVQTKQSGKSTTKSTNTHGLPSKHNKSLLQVMGKQTHYILILYIYRIT